MINQRFGPSFLSNNMIPHLVFLFLIDLKNRIKSALLCLYLLMGDVTNSRDSLPKRFLCSFPF